MKKTNWKNEKGEDINMDVKSNKWAKYDYIKIPTKNCIEFTEKYGDGYVDKNELIFIGEPIWEKEMEKNTYADINSSGISIGGIVKDNKLFDDNFIVFQDGVNKGIDIDCLMPNNHNAIKKCEIKVDKPNNIIGGKNMNKLLEIYKIKRIEEIDDKYSELRKGILQHDPLVQAAEEYNKKLEENLEDKTLVEEYKLNPERRVTTASKNILNDIEYKHEKEWEQIDDLLKTIQAHLDMADTFEQKQQILINYGIINSNGRLNINKEEVKEEIKCAVEEQPKKVAKKNV